MRVLLTTDTEMSSALHAENVSPSANFQLTVEGRCEDGSFGLDYQMGRMEEAGFRGVFFIDPMPALVYGINVVRDMVERVVERGHDAQLHVHTEWLAFVDPIAGIEPRGTNIADYTLDEQKVLLKVAKELLMEAGAPAPTAFRAGNYGANDDTLRALASLGFTHESSFNAAYLGNPCQISLPPDQLDMVESSGICEVPISSIREPSGNVRPAQICALSAAEMATAIDHSASQGSDFFNIVSHSFELIVRETRHANRIVVDRFDRLCQKIGEDPALVGSCMRTLGEDGQSAQPAQIGAGMRFHRMGEQLASKVYYEGFGAVPAIKTVSNKLFTHA